MTGDMIGRGGGSRQQLLRKLKLLYRRRYVERPRWQIEYFHKGGSRDIV